MSNERYSQDASQRERREVLRNDTYQSRAVTDLAMEAQGRFAAHRPQQVTGATPAPQYARLPEGNPWREDLVGVEPPLGVAVDAMDALDITFEELPPAGGAGPVASSPAGPTEEGLGAPPSSVPPIPVPPETAAELTALFRRGLRRTDAIKKGRRL